MSASQLAMFLYFGSALVCGVLGYVQGRKDERLRCAVCRLEAVKRERLREMGGK